MNDVVTVFKKEMLDIISARSAKKHAFGWVVFIIMFGVFIPMSQASYWIKESQLLSFHLIFVPLMITYTCIANSFAGRRETRIVRAPRDLASDNTLFMAKGLAGFVFSYIFYLIISLIGVISLNYVIYMNGEWHKVFIYSPPTLFAFIFFGAGLVSFAVSTGVFISLKVESVKVAQILSSGFYLLIGLPIMSGMVKVVAAWDFVLPACGVLFLIDALVFAAALKTFKQSRVVYDNADSVYDG